MRTPLFLAALIISCVPGVAFGEAKPLSKEKVQQHLSDALARTFEEMALGGEEAKRIFENEVLTDVEAFVSNYHASGDSMEVEVDRDKLKQFLRFRASLFSAGLEGGAQPKACVQVRAEPGCSRCEAVRDGVVGILADRLGRRGFASRVLGATLDGAELKGEGAFESAAVRAADAQCDGFLFAELRPAADQDEDSHVEQSKIRLNVYFSARDASGQKIRVKASGAVSMSQAGARGAPVALVGRPLSDLFAMAAEKSRPGATTTTVALNGTSEERYLRLEGVDSYAAYVAFKSAVSSGLPSLKLEERFISPGIFQFSVQGANSLVGLGAALKGLSLSGRSLQVLREGPDEVAVVLR